MTDPSVLNLYDDLLPGEVRDQVRFRSKERPVPDKLMFDPQVLLRPYQSVNWHVEPIEGGSGVAGWIVWRRGTGGNVELLHLKVAVPGRGTATRLLQAMLRKLKADPPYATVFGFTRVTNESAQGFYQASGFTLAWVPGVYADGEAVLFSAPYPELLERHGLL